MIQITVMNSESKVKVQYTLNLPYGLFRELLFHLFTDDIRIKHNECYWCADANEGFRIPLWSWGQKSMSDTSTC